MTPRGAVQIEVAPRLALAAGAWLIDSYEPSEGTILSGKVDDRPTAVRVGRQLLKSGKRKRNARRFKLYLQRDDARWLGNRFFVFINHARFAGFWGAPPPVLWIARACSEAVQKRRGNPRRLSSDDMARALQRRAGSKQWLRRLRARKQFDDWCRSVSERGETILTTSLPFTRSTAARPSAPNTTLLTMPPGLKWLYKKSPKF